MLLQLLKQGCSFGASQKAALTHFGSSLSSSLPKLSVGSRGDWGDGGRSQRNAHISWQGSPIVFLSNDIISAQNEWYDAERAFDQGRNAITMGGCIKTTVLCSSFAAVLGKANFRVLKRLRSMAGF